MTLKMRQYSLHKLVSPAESPHWAQLQFSKYWGKMQEQTEETLETVIMH